VEPLDQLDLVVPKLAVLVRGVRADQLDDPTPCVKFRVRDLLGHFLGNLDQVTRSFSGAPVRDLTPRPEIIGDDPGAAFDTLLGAFQAAMREPGAMERTIALPPPFGAVPAEVFVRFLVFDLMMHSWDLAKATGQTYAPPEAIVGEVDAFARQALAPELRDGDTFAAACNVAGGATAFDGLLAFAGRQP
jgi:uncharacterized protein (TIGR03086 family)